MSQRRMFSPDIVSSEEFLSMPVSGRELYFQLGMNADDDGFIQPKMIMRVAGATEDDLKILLAKRFLLPFESGVVVIKHWLIHNMIRADRYKPTRFQEEKKLLFIKENKAYTEQEQIGCQSVNQMAPQVRLGKVSNIESDKSDLVYEPLKGNKSKGAFLDRARAKLGKPPMLKKDPSTWGIINLYRKQYRYITGKEAILSNGDYFHILDITKKLSPQDMEAMVIWYVKMDNQKFKDHPNLKSIFTPENVNKFNLQK